VSTSQDYKGVPLEEAMSDIYKQCEKYKAAYKITDDDEMSYIEIYNLSSKMMMNRIYAMLAKLVVLVLMAWNIGMRSVYHCRPPAADTSTGCAGSANLPAPNASTLTIAINAPMKDGSNYQCKWRKQCCTW